jgi:hypothetical protein
MKPFRRAFRVACFALVKSVFWTRNTDMKSKARLRKQVILWRLMLMPDRETPDRLTSVEVSWHLEFSAHLLFHRSSTILLSPPKIGPWKPAANEKVHASYYVA